VIFMRKRPSLVYWLGDKLYLNITNGDSNDCYCMHAMVTNSRTVSLGLSTR